MSVLKKRLAAIVILSLFVVFVAGYLLLSGRTFYTSLVADKVGDAFRGMGGYDLLIDELTGNPLTGVDGARVRVVHDGVELASADRIEMRLDLASVASSPKLSRLSLSGLSADLETVMKHLPQGRKEPSGAPAVGRVVLRDSRISTPFGGVDVRDMTLSLGDGTYRVDLRGAYRGTPLSVKADLLASRGEMSLRALSAEWGDASLEASGAITPSLDLRAEVSGVDADALSEIVPQLKSSTVKGVYSAELHVRRGDAVAVSGEIRSGAGQLWLVPFEALRTNFDYEENRVGLRGLSARLFGGAASGDAEVAFVSGDRPALSARIVAADIDTGEMLALFPWLENFSGRLGGSCDIAGPVDALDGTASLRASEFNVFGFDVSGASADVRLSGSSELGLSFGGGTMGAKLRGEGHVSLKPGVKLVLEVDASGISLEALASRYPQIADAGVAGSGSAHVKIHGPLDALVFDGSVSFPSLTLMQAYKVSDASAGFSYSNSKKSLSLAGAKATFHDALLTAEGSRSTNLLDGLENLDFSGTVSNLKVENFANLAPAIGENHLKGTVSGKWVLNGTLRDPHVRVALNAPTFSLLKRFHLTNVAADAAYKGGSLEVSGVSARMGEASAAAAGNVALPLDGQSLAYNIKGSFKNLNPEDLVKMGLISGDLSGDLAGDFRVWSGSGEPPSARVFFKDAHFVYSNIFDVSNLRGTVMLRDGDVHLDNLRTLINTGYISVSGTVGNVVGGGFDPQKIPLDLDVSVASADIGRISRLFMPTSKGYQGMLAGNAEIKGSVADPHFKGEASLTGVRAFGLFLPIVRVGDVSGNLNEIRFPRVRAIVGRGMIDAHGSLARTAGWKASVEATGRSVDIRSLTFSLEREVRREIDGTLDFDFKGSGWLDSFEGNGEVRVPTFSAMGLKIADFCAPFWVNEGFVLIEDSSAKGYGGVLKAQIAKDLALSSWGGRLEVLSADFAAVLRDLMPNAEGSITGSADLTLRIEGDSTRTSMQDGSGSLEIRNGEISGFPGTEAASKIIGGRPLRFSSAFFSYSIDGKMLYLLPGSRVAAPSEDPAFKYVMVDGSVGIEEKKIDLSCMGNVNVRALNSFIGGLQSLVSAAMDDMGNTDALLQNFLGGALSGFSRNEFRDVSLVVKGTPDSLKFSDVEVAQPITYDTRPEVLNQTVNSRESDEDRFRLKVEIPVGPGGGRGDNVGSQVGGQVFEQAIKSLFSF